MEGWGGGGSDRLACPGGAVIILVTKELEVLARRKQQLHLIPWYGPDVTETS